MKAYVQVEGDVKELSEFLKHWKGAEVSCIVDVRSLKEMTGVSVPVPMPEKREAKVAERSHFKWRRKENAFLRKNFKLMSYAQMAERLGRTEKSVRIRCNNYLGLKERLKRVPAKPPKMSRIKKKWTRFSSHEDGILRELYQKKGAHRVAVLLRRDYRAVRNRAGKLGLTQVRTKMRVAKFRPLPRFGMVERQMLENLAKANGSLSYKEAWMLGIESIDAWREFLTRVAKNGLEIATALGVPNKFNIVQRGDEWVLRYGSS